MPADREIELKFLAEPDALRALQDEPPLSGAEPPRRENLRTTYFDTPDHRLKQEGIVLRLRRSGESLRQSVKRGAGVARSEWEHEIDDAFPDPALIGNRSVRSMLRKKSVARSLRSIFETDVERSSFLLQSNTAQIEVSVDRGEITANGHRLPISELELELKRGDAAELFQLAQKLVARAPLALSLVSKGERGFLLAEGKWGAASKATKPHLRRGMTAGAAFKAIGLTCLHAFMLNHAMLEKAEDIELVHQARIAIRRLRAAMSFFKPLVRDAGYDALRRDLKWISDLLGAARDLDVWQTETLKPKAEESNGDPGIALLVSHVEEQRQEAHVRLKEALSSARLREMLLKLTVWLETDDRNRAPKGSAGSIESFLDKHLTKRIDKLVKRGRRLDGMDEKAQHRLRIRAKKLRYICEFFESLSGGRKDRKAFKSLAGALEDMQSALGEIHDRVALASYLAEEFGRTGALRERPRHVPAAFAAGIVAQADTPRKKLVKDALRAYETLAEWRKFWAA